jgi:hypothetical protein
MHAGRFHSPLPLGGNAKTRRTARLWPSEARARKRSDADRRAGGATLHVVQREGWQLGPAPTDTGQAEGSASQRESADADAVA